MVTNEERVEVNSDVDRMEAAEAKVAQHETMIRALTTRINVAEPKLDAWRTWGREHGYGLGPEAALDGDT